MSSPLNDQDIEAIEKAAETIAMHAIGFNGQPSAQEVANSGVPMSFPAPLEIFVRGMKHMMKADDRIVRVCVIIESDNPRNSDKLRDDNLEAGDILISFGIIQDGSKEPRFVNFGLNMEEDLFGMANLYNTVTVMEEQLRHAMARNFPHAGEGATGGEDQ
jgi:hypothetical protein